MKFIKPFFLTLTLLVMTVSCSKSDDDEIIDSLTPPTSSTVSYQGSFISSAHPTSGTASINQEKSQLILSNFKTDSGPNLEIYLASNLSNIDGNYKNLGQILGLNGNYTYPLPSNIDYTVYKYVVVWCTDFKVNFSYATLIPSN